MENDMTPIVPEAVQKLHRLMTASERAATTEILSRNIDTLTQDECIMLVRLLEWG